MNFELFVDFYVIRVDRLDPYGVIVTVASALKYICKGRGLLKIDGG